VCWQFDKTQRERLLGKGIDSAVCLRVVFVVVVCWANAASTRPKMPAEMAFFYKPTVLTVFSTKMP
jgi:hypothetical protein